MRDRRRRKYLHRTFVVGRSIQEFLISSRPRLLEHGNYGGSYGEGLAELEMFAQYASLRSSNDITIEDIKNALSPVASEPAGYFIEDRQQPPSTSLEACYILG